MVGERLSSSNMRERDSMESPVVMGCVPVSAMIRTRSGALWKALPPFAVLRTAAWMSWHAALWRLMRKASWFGHSPAFYRAGIRLSRRGRISWLVCRYIVVRIGT